MAKEIKNTEDPKREFAFVFNKINYIIMIAGIVLLALGYIFLAGGGSDDPNVFNPEMFNGRRLYLAPILIILGLIVEIVAIMYRGKDSE
jgi:hypothetical protein